MKIVLIAVVMTVAQDWPMGLGPLESVPRRYPKQMRTAAAAELDRLALATVKPSGPDPAAKYVSAQLERADRTIDPAPPIHPNAAAIRTLLLSGRPIEWEVDISRGTRAPLPNLNVHMKLSRLLTVSALERARLGDAGAWDDLRAQRVLSRGLWQRPEFISAIIASAIDRNILAAARKMPLPAPAWFGEMRTFDYRKAMLAATQADTWMISAAIDEYSKADDAGHNWVQRVFDRMITEPYTELSRADLVERQRDLANEIAKRTTCGLDVPAREAAWWNRPASIMTPNINLAWQRVFRLRADLELTEHALGLRSGTQSRCSDGHWIVTPASVKFSKTIPLDGAAAEIPLELRR